MSEPYIGEIRLVGFNFAPYGWALCDGAVQSIAQNSTLFNLIGTTYGGDGQQTFNLPNLLGRVPIHQGANAYGTYVLGQASGTETVTLATSNIPAHSHQALGSSATAVTASPTAASYPATTASNLYVTPPATTVAMTATSPSSGGNQPHDNMMPFVCINYVIALFGVYPSQS
jgi:microcystin-dependent protein